MKKPTYPLSAIAILLDFYARFVLLAKWGDRDAAGQQRKRPLRRNWPKLSPTFMEIKDHVDQGGLLGLVPASLTSTALDVDRGDPVPLLANYIPWAVCPSLTSGRLHLWYRDSTARPQAKWRYAEGGAGGELISQHPYVVLWGEALQQLADALTEGDLPGQAHFDQVAPALTGTAAPGDGHRAGPPTGRNRRPTIYRTFAELTFVNPGERNDALYDVLGHLGQGPAPARNLRHPTGVRPEARGPRHKRDGASSGTWTDFPDTEASAIGRSVANYWPGKQRGTGHGPEEGGDGHRPGGLGEQGYRGDPALNCDSEVQRWRRGRRTALDAVRTGHRQTQVAARFRLGAPVQDLATAFGCTPRTIWRDLEEAGLPSRRQARRMLQADGQRRRRKRGAATGDRLQVGG